MFAGILTFLLNEFNIPLCILYMYTLHANTYKNYRVILRQLNKWLLRFC